MFDPCCTTMMVMTMTKADIQADEDLMAGRADLGDHQPLVEWREHIGAFVIGRTAIFHCPWCGARLPEDIEAARVRAQKEGVWVDCAWDGSVSVTIKGQPTDPEAFFAELREATRGQD